MTLINMTDERQRNFFILLNCRFALSVMARGMKMRNVNLHLIITKLEAMGIRVKGRTAKTILPLVEDKIAQYKRESEVTNG